MELNTDSPLPGPFWTSRCLVSRGRGCYRLYYDPKLFFYDTEYSLLHNKWLKNLGGKKVHTRFILNLV